MNAFLFFVGLVVGSFLNVVILRYNPEKFLFGKALGGRSRCRHCKKTLRWFELVPIASFLLQGGRCRSCRAPLSLQYPIVEILSGLIFVFVPLRLGSSAFEVLAVHSNFYIPFILWVAFFLILLLIAVIDFRLLLIPDEANIFLMILATLIVFVGRARFSAVGGSFLGSYAFLFGLRSNIWANHFFAALIAGLIFMFIVGITRGRGMGMGDVKLVVPLGFAFGWPDIVFLVMSGFIIGSIFGVCAISLGTKRLKSTLPLGPFLVGAAALTFFFGYDFLRLYFGLFRL